MRDWLFEDIGGGFSEFSCVIESSKEEAQFLKAFPSGVPGEAGAKDRLDVELVWHFENVPTPGGQSLRKLFVRPQLRVVSPSSGGGGADVSKIADVSTRIAELVKKSEPELETLAGELGVKFPKKATAAQKAAMIVQAQDKLAAQNPSAEGGE